MKKKISVIKSLFEERGRKVECGLSEDQSSGTFSPLRESSVRELGSPLIPQGRERQNR